MSAKQESARVKIIVALIGAVAAIVAAVFGSPVLVDLFSRNEAKTPGVNVQTNVHLTLDSSHESTTPPPSSSSSAMVLDRIFGRWHSDEVSCRYALSIEIEGQKEILVRTSLGAIARRYLIDGIRKDFVLVRENGVPASITIGSGDHLLIQSVGGREELTRCN